MKLISPYALWFLTLIPLLILMYILKQRYEERQVSSLYLWHQVIMDLDATSPFQRLKRNLLLFLQLLILLLCIFALTNPFVWWKNNNYENLVLIVDASGSMSSAGDKGTRLSEAKEKAETLINSLSSGTKITLISAARNVKVEASGSSDKKEVLNKLNAIAPTNSAGNIGDAYSLVKAICQQYQSYKVVYYTDGEAELDGLNGEVVKLGPGRPNVSLDYMAQSKEDNGLKVMLRVTNHGGENNDAEICLYGEDKLISIKDEPLKAGETKTVYFDNVPGTYRYIYGELTKEDGLMEDNKIYSVVKQMDAKKIVLSTTQNVFLEKALNTLKDIELYKTLPGEKIDGEFDLYIYDGDFQGDIPKSGSLLFINPQKDTPFFKVGTEIPGGRAEVIAHSATKYMNNSDFVISALKAVTPPYWASPLLRIGENDAAFAGEEKGRKVAVVAFDLHASDFPLTPEFPIFVNNLISYLMDRDTMANTNYACGESVEITPLPEAEKLFVKSPAGQSTELSSKYPIKPFEDTYTPGIYEISQKVGDKEVGKLVSVNFPVSESGTGEEGIGGQGNVQAGAGEETAAAADNGASANTASDGSMGGINLLNILLALALLVIIAEWAAYIKQ